MGKTVMSAHDPFLVFALDSKDCVLFDFSAQLCFLRTVICKMFCLQQTS